MAEAAKVRLVRCPKCENLLPELPDFSLYKCGGCGAVLEALKKGILEDGLSEISDDVNDRGISEEGSIVKVSEVVMETADGIEGSRVERTHEEGAASDGSSKSRAESREVLSDYDVSRRGKERISRQDSFEGEYRSYSQGLVRNRNHDQHSDLDEDRPEHVRFRGEHVKEVRPPMDSMRLRPIMDERGVKSNGPMASGGPARGVRFDDLPYLDEGQSSYDMNSYYEHGGRYSYRGHDVDGVSRIENLENGRAELLRRLDELKEQISRSRDGADKPNERIHMDRRMVSPTSPDTHGRHHEAHVQDGLASSQGVKKQPLAPDDMVPPYFNHPRGFVPYMDRYGSRVSDSYPQGYPHEFPHYVDPYKQEMLRRPPRPLQSQYMQRPYDDHFHGYYGDVNHDLFMLQRHENFFHQPACSCVHCCDKNWHLPPKVDPPSLHNRRSQNEPSNPNFHQHPNPILHRPQGNSSGGSNLYPLHSRQSLTLNSNDPDSESDGFSYHRPRKFVVSHRSGRLSYPIAGAAPFITCNNCFELLKLPRKHISLAINKQNMKCGACSSIILFELGNKGFIASASTHADQVPTEIDEGSIGTVDENVRYWNDGSNGANMNTCSSEYDDPQHKFSATEKKSNSGESEKHLVPLSSTSSISDDEPIPENILSRNRDSPSTELSPQECPNHSPEEVAVGRFDKGNNSKRAELEKASLDRTTSLQNSVKDAAVATEIDVSLNEFSNSYASQDSIELSKEDHAKVNKGAESFLAGLIKKSFRDFKKSNQDVEVGVPQVFVNGHFIPDRVVKKAEKLAGPIQPGEYWYDKKAGFWGVMGHPCFGIIMPNIEEFNYPIPENCAAGNTGVFVNGRELHQKDLDLLASRGLPITEHRSYTIEITGKVVDEQTGEELDGLGKLAPTVEKAKHGFGMKVPRFIAQSQS